MKASIDALFERLSRSAFRSRFRLQSRDLAYARARGVAELRGHAFDMLRTRLFAPHPANDGKQTPFRGHPVFVAQHATGTCCRGCLLKWHGIEKGRELSEGEREYVVEVILCWIERELTNG